MHYAEHKVAQGSIGFAFTDMIPFGIICARRRIRHLEVDQLLNGAFQNLHRLLRILQVFVLDLAKEIFQKRHHIFYCENIVAENAHAVAQEALENSLKINAVVFQQVHQPACGRYCIQPARKETARHGGDKIDRIALAVGKCVGILLIIWIGLPIQLIAVVPIRRAKNNRLICIVRIRIHLLHPIYWIGVNLKGKLIFSLCIVKPRLTEKIRVAREGICLDIIDRFAVVGHRLSNIVLVHVAGKYIVHARVRQRFCHVLIVIQAEILRNRRLQPHVGHQAEMR